MSETAGTVGDIRHPWFSRVYPRIAAGMEAKGGSEHRDELLSGLTGRVVEIGAGHGVNFAHYPSSVTEVVAIEPEPRLRALAEEAAADVSIPVHVMPGTAEHLPLEDGSCDAVVFSLVLCSIGDVGAALAEARRVLRAGGELRFYEHVCADTPGLARVQRAVDVVWPHLAGGCHTNRDTVAGIVAAGFEITACRRFLFKPCVFDFAVAPHVIGTAMLPAV